MPDDSLDRLSKKLDASKEEHEIRRSQLFPKAPESPHAWAPKAPEPDMSKRKRRFSAFEIIFGVSAVFFAAAIGIAALLFFTGGNTVSTKNVDVQVSGPSSIRAGDTLSLQVVITNKNAVPMQLTDLVVEFPPGTRSDNDVSLSLPRVRDSLGTINPGESANRTVKAVIFGAASQSVPIKVSAEYRVPSSNAIFVSETDYTTQISQSPASITVEANKEAVSGQAATLTVTLTSNSPQVLKDMLLAATYPPGFQFQSSTPAPVSGNNVWNLGDIESNGTRTITINGTFTGEEGDQKTINLTAGNKKSSYENTIAAPLATAEADVTVTKPFISVGIALNDVVADVHTVPRGGKVDGVIQWANNLPVSVQNLSITLKFNGQILDKNAVTALQGFYRSGDSSILWDKSTDGDFANVAPGAGGTLSFSFATLPASQGSFRNPELDMAVTVHADRQSESNVPETVDSTTATKALVSSNINFAAALSRNNTFTNTGPVPPKADTETTYTVTWNLSNAANALANTQVTASLPNYVKFKNLVLPSSEKVTFDDRLGVVTWNVGDMPALSSRSVSFQVGVTPSISQVSQAPDVITNQQASGFDRFVQDTVSASAGTLTTGSGAASQQQGLVVP